MRKLKLGSKKHLFYMVLGQLVGAVLFGILTMLLGDIADYGSAQDLQSMFAVLPVISSVVVLVFCNDMLLVKLNNMYIKNSVLLMKHRYLDGLMDQDITQLQKEFTATYRSQLTQDMDRYESKFFEQVVNIAHMGSQGVTALVILFTVNVYIGLIALLLVGVFVYISTKSSKPIQQDESKKSASLNRYTSFLEESLDGFEVTKQHQLEERRKELFAVHARQVQNDNYAIDVKTTYLDALNTTIQLLVIFLATVGGLLFAMSTGATLGAVIKIVMSFSNVIGPMQQMVPTITQMVGIQDVLTTFDASLNHEDYKRPVAVSTFDTLAFNHTDLGYDRTILEDVELSIRAKEKVLIVGPSGAGKSTILKTMRQSIMPLTHSVTLNGHAIQTIDALDYYRLFSTVDQTGFIFNGTLKENVTLHQKVDQESIVNALKAVHLDDLDMNMKLINNGGNLSGGQRARVLSARALCLNASIIVCDEIFAALDTEIAKTIEHDLLQLKQAIVNVSHIYFEENVDAYDSIYKVENGKLTRVTDNQVLLDAMLDPTL